MESKKINNNEHPYVDLGLPSGTLWAICNVGASKPSELGLYFQWGDTKGSPRNRLEKTSNSIGLIISGIQAAMGKHLQSMQTLVFHWN